MDLSFVPIAVSFAGLGGIAALSAKHLHDRHKAPAPVSDIVALSDTIALFSEQGVSPLLLAHLSQTLAVMTMNQLGKPVAIPPSGGSGGADAVSPPASAPLTSPTEKDEWDGHD